MAKVRQDELCHRYLIYLGLMQLPGLDSYILNKAFTFKFSFSLDPPNSKAIVAAEEYEFGNLAEAQTLAAPLCGGAGMAGCSQEAVQERNL